VSVFPKTRAAAGHIAGAGPGELARARAAILLARLGACEDILPGDGDVPAVLHGLLRDLVLAVRDLAGTAWLDASGDDPDVAAFTVLEAAASPPDPARIDEICSRGCGNGSPQAPAGMTRATAAPPGRPAARAAPSGPRRHARPCPPPRCGCCHPRRSA
jgi:hypothetical protein